MRPPSPVPVHPTLRLPDACERIALYGGPYGNFAVGERVPANRYAPRSAPTEEPDARHAAAAQGD